MRRRFQPILVPLTVAGDLIGYFSAVVWFLPILGGTLADWLGFRRSLALAYFVLGVGYFLLGSLSAPWMAPLRDSMPLATLVLLVLTIPALGPAIVKPCVVGSTARASKENVRSLGYSIYYTLVNVGGEGSPRYQLVEERGEPDERPVGGGGVDGPQGVGPEVLAGDLVLRHAALRGRDFGIPDDIKHMAVACLAHRMIMNPENALGGDTTVGMVRELLKRVEVPLT